MARRLVQHDTYTTKSRFDDNQTIQVGDTVLVYIEGDREKPFVAKIEKFYKKGGSSGKMMMDVQWFFAPEELEGGRRDFHGANEVFLSDLVQEGLEAASIECKCIVSSLAEYEQLEDRSDNNFFCRAAYSPGPPPVFHPEEIDVYCICKRPYNPDKCLLKCGSCKDRFHPSCMNMNDEGAKELARVSHFYCKTCLPKALEEL